MAGRAVEEFEGVAFEPQRKLGVGTRERHDSIGFRYRQVLTPTGRLMQSAGDDFALLWTCRKTAIDPAPRTGNVPSAEPVAQDLPPNLPNAAKYEA